MFSSKTLLKLVRFFVLRNADDGDLVRWPSSEFKLKYTLSEIKRKIIKTMGSPDLFNFF